MDLFGRAAKNAFPPYGQVKRYYTNPTHNILFSLPKNPRMKKPASEIHVRLSVFGIQLPIGVLQRVEHVGTVIGFRDVVEDLAGMFKIKVPKCDQRYFLWVSDYFPRLLR